VEASRWDPDSSNRRSSREAAELASKSPSRIAFDCVIDTTLPPSTRKLLSCARNIAADVLAPNAARTDAECAWPAHAFDALRETGLLGLHVPKRFGGHEEGLLALAAMTEALATGCSSAAICYGMHCVGSAVITAKATPDHEERYLRPIARGEHITTLSLSETGAGAHFYLPQTTLRHDGNDFVVQGTKQFVTNAEHAHSYVISAEAEGSIGPGEFSCLIVDGDTEGLRWLEPWRGFGMRGNASRGLELRDVRVPTANLLGAEGDQIWYIFEVVAPYFLVAMAGTYVGIAQAAVDLTIEHLNSRRYEASGERLADVPLLQHRLAEMWTMVEKTRLLVRTAARLGDLGDEGALVRLLACKSDAADTAVAVTNEAMTLGGGIAYRENSTLARLLRDARAGHVMSPTTEILKQWQGRALLGMPLM
jgi:isovaleryl-CoA dehydrogenase